MPLYEYACPECARRIEVFQRMGAGGEELECPACHHEGLVRQLSVFAAGGSSSKESFGGACESPGSGACAPSGGG